MVAPVANSVLAASLLSTTAPSVPQRRLAIGTPEESAANYSALVKPDVMSDAASRREFKNSLCPESSPTIGGPHLSETGKNRTGGQSQSEADTIIEDFIQRFVSGSAPEAVDGYGAHAGVQTSISEVCARGHSQSESDTMAERCPQRAASESSREADGCYGEDAGVQTSISFPPKAEMHAVNIQKQNVGMRDTFVHFACDCQPEPMRRSCSAPSLSIGAAQGDALYSGGRLLQWAPSTGAVFDVGATYLELQDEASTLLQRFFRRRWRVRSRVIAEQIQAVLSHLCEEPPLKNEAQLIEALSKVPPFPSLGDGGRAEASAANLMSPALPMYYMKILNVGPRVLTVEPCRYFISGCHRGDGCRFSHLCHDDDEAIRGEFKRSPLDLSGASPAFSLARQARREGLSAPEIYNKFPDSFPAREEHEEIMKGEDSSELPRAPAFASVP